MVVATDTVARRYEGVSTGTPISVDIPAYEAGDVYVYYGNASLVAVQGVDYTVELAGDFETFTITPQATLLSKINTLIAADSAEENFITVRRELDYLTEATAAGVRYTPFTSREFDRNAMRDQQLAEAVRRAVKFPAGRVGENVDGSLSNVGAGQVLRMSDDLKQINGVALSITVSEATVVFQTRDTATAIAAAALADGTIVMIEGLQYQIDSTATGSGSATNDLGVDGIVAYGTVQPQHFGAKGDGLTDDTAAFTAAQQASKFIYVPPGQYLVDGLRIYDQVFMLGSGYENTVFIQKSAGTSAINCTSDATTGQLLSLRLLYFSVRGHASSTVPTVTVAAAGVYAIYRSVFDIQISGSYKGLYVDASTANNVFQCNFIINSVGSTDWGVETTGGVYNEFDLFIVDTTGGKAARLAGFNNVYRRLVADGQIWSSEQNCLMLAPTIEEWKQASPPAGTMAFRFTGFNQTIVQPTLILNAANSAKLDYAIQPFAYTTIIAPRLIVDAALTDPFTTNTNEWTLHGPGQNGCANFMETIYTGADNSRDMRRVGLVGNCTDFTQRSAPQGGKVTQYLAPTGDFNLQVLHSTDAMIIDRAATTAVANITLAYGATADTIRDGLVLSLYTTGAITTANFAGGPAGTDASLFPSSLSAGQTLNYVYRKSTNKWYPIS